MEITRNVILDILPLYLAGEVSPDTPRPGREILRNRPGTRRVGTQAKISHGIAWKYPNSPYRGG